jgi:hypothetical protein
MLREPRLVLAALIGFGVLGTAQAEDAAEWAQKLANDRARVETAMSLVTLGEAENDGQMLAVAAKLLADVGPVALPGKTGADGTPEFIDLEALIGTAGRNGGDVGRARTAMSVAKPAPRCLGYWREVCDYNNYCRWEYVC